MSKNGLIYILTNPSFEQYIKIGYTTDLGKRINDLSSRTAVPYSFQPYATWDVPDMIYEKYGKHSDDYIHNLIDSVNPDLRCIEYRGTGKKRTREFYVMSPENAFKILKQAAAIFGDDEQPQIYKKTQKELEEIDSAEEDAQALNHNRHHFKDIKFKSSLTDKEYFTKTKDNGTLGIYELKTEEEIPNHFKPSKRQIVLQACKDLELDVKDNDTLYCLIHKLEKEKVKKE